MKYIDYDIQLLVHKFPSLQDQILSRDFLVFRLGSDDGSTSSPIVRFPNLSVFAPDAPLIERIFNEIFGDPYKFNDITFRQYGICGIEITTKGTPR